MSTNITESEYHLGAGTGCPVKIHHLRAQLPRNDTANTFAQWMRSESGKIHALARHLFPAAVDANADVDQTRLLLDGKGTVANATFVTKEVSCRVDFVTRDGDFIRLYQVVPKCVDLDQHNRRLEFTTQAGNLRKEWRGHYELMALRTWVVQQLYPKHQVIPLFVAPIRGAIAQVEGLHGFFVPTTTGWHLADSRAAAQASVLLRTISVRTECQPLLKSVPGKLAAVIAAAHSAPQPAIGYKCKNCEFRTGPGGGFARCWGALADVTPHIFDLGYMYFIQDLKGRPVADRLAWEGKVSLFDIPEERIVGEHAARQFLQIEGTRNNYEIIDPELANPLRNVSYPLLFLDIETIRSAIPCHRGEVVNGLSLFQFSVHRRDEPGGPLTHVGWLNTAPECPNGRFLTALRATLGDIGSVVVFTHYEQTSFAELLADMIGSGEENDDMRWLKQLLVGDRVLDLHRLCTERYFHPLMLGRTSIKSLLPAVWSNESPIKALPPYNAFPVDTDPYRFLKNKGHVADGCDAMTAYLRLQSESGETRKAAMDELLAYCYVDTLAMAFVFDYWNWCLGVMREGAVAAPGIPG